MPPWSNACHQESCSNIPTCGFHALKDPIYQLHCFHQGKTNSYLLSHLSTQKPVAAEMITHSSKTDKNSIKLARSQAHEKKQTIPVSLCSLIICKCLVSIKL